MSKTGFPTVRISRRSVIGGVGVAMGLSLVGCPSIASADGSSLVQASPLSEHSWVATSPSALASVPAALGAELHISGAELVPGSVIRVMYDPRIYAVSQPRAILPDGRTIGLSVTSSEETTTSAHAAVSIELPIALVGDVTLLVGYRRLDNYPEDIVAAPLSSAIFVNGVEVVWLSSRRRAMSETTASIWGLSIGVGWDIVRWGKGYHSWLPGIVTVFSTGPGAIPPGTDIRVSLDSRLVHSFRLRPLSSASPNQEPSTNHTGIATALWKLDEPIAAGQYASAWLDGDVVKSPGSLPLFNAPTVQSVSIGNEAGQRITGRESMIREDSLTG